MYAGSGGILKMMFIVDDQPISISIWNPISIWISTGNSSAEQDKPADSKAVPWPPSNHHYSWQVTPNTRENRWTIKHADTHTNKQISKQTNKKNKDEWESRACVHARVKVKISILMKRYSRLQKEAHTKHKSNQIKNKTKTKTYKQKDKQSDKYCLL